MKKTHLGNAVYAKLTDDGELVLTRETGMFIREFIILDRDLLTALCAYLHEAGRLCEDYKGQEK